MADDNELQCMFLIVFTLVTIIVESCLSLWISAHENGSCRQSGSLADSGVTVEFYPSLITTYPQDIGARKITRQAHVIEHYSCVGFPTLSCTERLEGDETKLVREGEFRWTRTIEKTKLGGSLMRSAAGCCHRVLPT